MPVRPTPFGSRIKDVPDGHAVRRPARILTGIDGHGTHFTAPEVADHTVLSGEDREGCVVFTFGTERMIVSAVVAAGVGVELQSAPAPLHFEPDQPIDRRARHDRKCNALLYVDRLAVPGAQ